MRVEIDYFTAPARVREERLDLWIDAMRSGDYKFGYDGLRANDESWHPLGVLCDVSELGEWESIDRLPYLFVLPCRQPRRDWMYAVPAEVLEWLFDFKKCSEVRKSAILVKFPRVIDNLTRAADNFQPIVAALEQLRAQRA